MYDRRISLVYNISKLKRQAILKPATMIIGNTHSFKQFCDSVFELNGIYRFLSPRQNLQRNNNKLLNASIYSIKQ